jgi:3-hydroxyisobutyrate dehydrogenase
MSSAPRPRIAVLGTGTVGTPIAARLLAAGFPVSVWNRTRSKAEALTDKGARLAHTPAAAAATADILLTMLPDEDAISRTMVATDGALARLAPGVLWVQMGTIGVEACERLAELARLHRLVFVDAPVLGSDAPARERRLFVLASGPEAARAHVQPVFDAIGPRTLWLGPAGNGMRVKLAVDSWLLRRLEATAAALAVSRRYAHLRTPKSRSRADDAWVAARDHSHRGR